MSSKKIRNSNLFLRLREVREILDLSQKDFAVKAGISRGHVSMLESGKANPSPGMLALIQGQIGISAHWLETGEGERIAAPCGLKAPQINGAKLEGVEMTADDFEYVPIMNEAAAAGLPAVIGNEFIEDMAIIHRSWLRKGRHVCFCVRGNSMSPVLESGFLVAANLERRDPVNLTGQIVLAKLDDGITIKRLAGNGGGYFLVPENREYPPIALDPAKVTILGAVEWWFGHPGNSDNGGGVCRP